MCNFSVLRQSSVTVTSDLRLPPAPLIKLRSEVTEMKLNVFQLFSKACKGLFDLPSTVRAAMGHVLLVSFHNSEPAHNFEDHFSIKCCFLACNTLHTDTWNGWLSVCSTCEAAGQLDLPPLPLEKRWPFIVQAEMILSAWDRCFGGSAAGKHLHPISLQVLVSTTVISRSNMGSCLPTSVTSISLLQITLRAVVCCKRFCWETYDFFHGRVGCCKTNGCTVNNTRRRGKICTSCSEKWGFQRGNFIWDFRFKAAQSSKVSYCCKLRVCFFSFWTASWLHCRWIYLKHIEFNQTLWVFFLSESETE